MKWSWTDEDTEEGYRLLSQAFDDPTGEIIKSWYAWVYENVAISMPIVEMTFGKLYRLNQKELALKLYRAMVPQNNNPIPGNIAYLVQKYGVRIVICTSIIGGMAWLLFRWVF